MKPFKVMLAIVCATALPLLANAGEEGKKAEPMTTDMEKKQFQRLDANKDGVISEEEAKEGNIEQFSKADTNNDGQLTLAEYVAVVRNEVSAR